MTAMTLTPVSPEELLERTEAGTAFVIDVRTPAEFAVEHIAGSYNVPLDTLKEHVRDVAERLHGDVVLVCASGVRASDAQQRLTGAGFTEAAVLSGGIGSYAQAGGDVVRRGTGWGMERQVRMTAGSLVLAGPYDDDLPAGALLLMRAETPEAALELLAPDPLLEVGVITERTARPWKISIGQLD